MNSRKPTAERRTEIADAAIKIIGERGLREFTAAQIAEEVGIKDGTIFRHFKDMQEIVAAVFDRIEEILTSRAPSRKSDPLERLEAFFMDRLRAVATQPGLLSLIFSDQLAHAMGNEGVRRLARLRDAGREQIRGCLREAEGAGLISKGTDIESAVLLINGMAMSVLFASKDGALDAPIEKVARRTWKTLLDMLRR